MREDLALMLTPRAFIVGICLLVVAPVAAQTPEIRVRQSSTPFGPVLIAETPQLTLTAALSDEQLTPGKPLKITLDVEPARGVHVYAPGKHPYQVVKVTLDAKPWLRALPAHVSRVGDLPLQAARRARGGVLEAVPPDAGSGDPRHAGGEEGAHRGEERHRERTGALPGV